VQAERLIVLGTIRMLERHLDGKTYLTSRTNHVYLVKNASDDRLQNAFALLTRATSLLRSGWNDVSPSSLARRGSNAAKQTLTIDGNG